jgi:hypothetical protein
MDDRVEVVEVKLILERVCVGEADRQQDGTCQADRLSITDDIFDANSASMPRKLYNESLLQKIILGRSEIVYSSRLHNSSSHVLDRCIGSRTTSSFL